MSYYDKKPSPFKENDRVKMISDSDIPIRDWKETYGRIPIDSVLIVSHSYSTCVAFKLPYNWKELGARNYQDEEAEDGVPYGFGFYADNFMLVTELPEELFEI